MDIVRLKGGLGNQMFQYALVEALRSRGRTVGCSIGFYRQHRELASFILDKVFPNIELNEVADEEFEKINERWKKIKADVNKRKEYENDMAKKFFYIEKEDGIYDEEIFGSHDCVFVGYWQTEKYFLDIRQRILKCFAFHIEDSPLLEYGNRFGENYYSVHIRRGDYLNAYDNYGGICTKEYYDNAIEYVKNRDPKARFVFFSDDMEWVLQNFERKQEYLFLDKHCFTDYQDWYDMYLMTKCAGNIVANSSFSWWGAWLNQAACKIVIAPKIWFQLFAMKDIWCDGWVKI